MGQAAGEIILETPKIAEALARRAERGRIDAAKFGMEIAGLYTQKSQVEHSGEVKLSIAQDVPRPPRAKGIPEETSEPVVDAEVVEE